MYCANCGKSINANDRFCKYCGAAQVNSDQSSNVGGNVGRDVQVVGRDIVQHNYRPEGELTECSNCNGDGRVPRESTCIKCEGKGYLWRTAILDELSKDNADNETGLDLIVFGIEVISCPECGSGHATFGAESQWDYANIGPVTRYSATGLNKKGKYIRQSDFKIAIDSLLTDAKLYGDDFGSGKSMIGEEICPTCKGVGKIRI